mgnify:CR=1 FL=1
MTTGAHHLRGDPCPDPDNCGINAHVFGMVDAIAVATSVDPITVTQTLAARVHLNGDPMTDQAELFGMPSKVVPVAISGAAVFDPADSTILTGDGADVDALRVGDILRVSVEVEVVKVGLQRTDHGPAPYAVAKITTGAISTHLGSAR